MGLKTNKSNTVAIIIPDIGNVYVAHTIPIIVDILRKNGYATIICDSRSDHEREIELVNFAMAKRVDGIINMPVGADGSHLNTVLENNIPVVLLDRVVTHCIGRVDAVLVDNIRAAEDAISYLVENGHKEIGIIAGPRDVTTAMDRMSGYIAMHKKNRLAVKDSLIEHSDYIIEGGYNACKRLLNNNPEMTALFATNYDFTVGAMMAINERGISVPEAISVFGFDDMPFAKVIKPHLSVIAQPIKEIGKSAAQMILNRMSNKNGGQSHVVMLRTKSVIRDSVCAVTRKQTIRCIAVNLKTYINNINKERQLRYGENWLRPCIDGRRNGAREGLEDQTMGMAVSAAKLITENLKYSNGEPIEVVIADTTIGGVKEAVMCQEKFEREGVGVTLTVSPCWCYSTEVMDQDPATIKAVWGFNGTERPGAVFLAAVLAAHSQKGLPAFGIYGHDVKDKDDFAIPEDVQEKILRFVKCGIAVKSMRTKSYLQIGSMCMGIAGSIIDQDMIQQYFGMRSESVDETEILRRIDNVIYDTVEYEKALAWAKEKM